MPEIPTLEQIQAYARAANYVSNPLEFYEKYRRANWKINGEPVQNWRRLFDGWERTTRAKQKPQVLPEYKTAPAEQIEMSAEERAEILADINAMIAAIENNPTIEAAREEYERTKNR